mmetsp:Transcript_15185/g.45464  ORF Transcript_15185/g.45464 Transcript_15185/m.45464 type:complete len:258 (-) Transcript_15185:264-1037(-)
MRRPRRSGGPGRGGCRLRGRCATPARWGAAAASPERWGGRGQEAAPAATSAEHGSRGPQEVARLFRPPPPPPPAPPPLRCSRSSPLLGPSPSPSSSASWPRWRTPRPNWSWTSRGSSSQPGRAPGLRRSGLAWSSLCLCAPPSPRPCRTPSPSRPGSSSSAGESCCWSLEPLVAARGRWSSHRLPAWAVASQPCGRPRAPWAPRLRWSSAPSALPWRVASSHAGPPRRWSSAPSPASAIASAWRPGRRRDPPCRRTF